MARRPRASSIETRTSRLKLPVREKPHAFTGISPGIALGYRRNRGSGTWVVRVADGKGGNWTKRVGLADDFEAADGEHVLDWWQAIDKARKLARADAGRPVSVADAVNAYERDLIARGGSVANAGRIRKHLTQTLASKPVGLLTSREMSAWRDGLIADGMPPATVVRLCRATKAALNLAARHDHRILNRAAWGDGLSGIAETFASRNIQRLDDDQVRALIAAAYAVDSAFGAYLETAAVTGSRLNQIARLVVSDLQAGNGAPPRLLMPSSRKGRGRKPAKRPIPITQTLAAKLQSDRNFDAPLLLRSDGRAWQSSREGDHAELYRRAAERAGIAGTTMYALRHSSIIRSLLLNVPARVVAAQHDTSLRMLERTYSAFITDHADAVARAALLNTAPPPEADNVVALAGRRP
jgi:integrase